MIGFLRGIIVEKRLPLILLEVQGIGYEVDTPLSTFYALPDIGHEVRLHTHLVIREDAHTLFGFFSEQERELFRILIKVNGVGARLALAILSGVSVAEFYRCVEVQDIGHLVRLPGVGRKTAERLIIELKDRLPHSDKKEMVVVASSSPFHPREEALKALSALGFKPSEANALMQKIPHKGKTTEEIIRLALQAIAK